MKILLRLTAIFAVICTCKAYAITNPQDLLQPDYLYADDDIRLILQNKLHNKNIYIAPALPFESQELIRDVITASYNEAVVIGRALIPINFGNGHWAGLAIKHHNGQTTVIYNDSVATPLSDRVNSDELIRILRNLSNNIQIIDLQLLQQRSGVACGGFAAENLIALANLNINDLSADQIRAILSKINDDGIIRQEHYILLGGDPALLNDTINRVNQEQVLLNDNKIKSLANLESDQLVNISEQLINRLGDVNSALSMRISNLSKLQKLQQFSGIGAAGDETNNYGVWAKTLFGNAIDQSKTSSKVKTNIYGYAIGLDSLLNDDLLLGFSFSNIKSNSKFLSSNLKNSLDSKITSLYSDFVITDSLSLNSLINYGIANLKNHQGKSKAHLASINLTALYDYQLGDNLILTPLLGFEYDFVQLQSKNNGIIQVYSNKQHNLYLSPAFRVSSLMNIGPLLILPEAHIEYSHAMLNNNKDIKILNKIDQLVLSQKSNNARNRLKLGLAMNILINQFEIGGGYDYIIQKKSNTQMFYGKLRLNF